jgi:hypothetical protein
MSNQTFFITAATADRTRYRITLLPLSAYEADGGNYADQDGPVDRAEFRCAFRAEERAGDEWIPANNLDAAAAAGVPAGALWHHHGLGWDLLRAWPAAAPLAARLVNS